MPAGQRDNVIAAMHGTAHIGPDATIRSAKLFFWWPDMASQIRRAIAGCATCQRVNARRHQQPGNLGDVERDRTITRFAEYEVDTYHVGHELGGGRVLTVIERMSGLVLSKVVLSSTAADAWTAFTDLVIRPFGVPRIVYTDNGTEFQGEFAERLRSRSHARQEPTGQPQRRSARRAPQPRPQRPSREDLPGQRPAQANRARRATTLG